MKKILLRAADLLLLPFSLVVLPFLWAIRRLGVAYFPFHLRLFKAIGVFPIREHYYEPRLRYPKDFTATENRKLFLDFNIPAQLSLLEGMTVYKKELSEFAEPHHASFGAGDAELYYGMIRKYKPAHIIEIGSGQSTRIALCAIAANKREGHAATLTCIEPFEQGWLDAHTAIRVIRKPVEQVPIDFFAVLGEGDILFIDSSHIIRPGNDVLFAYLTLLPSVKKGVLVHIHDIFSPLHYRQDWLDKLYRFWNEQYLLEAFLYYNESFEILLSLHHLKQAHFPVLKEAAIHLRNEDEPSSFWLRKTG